MFISPEILPNSFFKCHMSHNAVIVEPFLSAPDVFKAFIFRLDINLEPF